MSGKQACATPLIERLRSIPKDAHLTYEHSPFNHSMFPVGLMAHEAADALTATDSPKDDAVERVARAILNADVHEVLFTHGFPEREATTFSRAAIAALSNKDDEALAVFERVTRLADNLASDVPITAEARKHIDDAYRTIRVMRGSVLGEKTA